MPISAMFLAQAAKREEVHEWVLSVSMDQHSRQTLPLDERGCFQGALTDPKTGRSAPACIIAGLWDMMYSIVIVVNFDTRRIVYCCAWRSLSANCYNNKNHCTCI